MTVLAREFSLVRTIIGLTEAELGLGVPHPSAETADGRRPMADGPEFYWEVEQALKPVPF
jgi:hypothetical protein